MELTETHVTLGRQLLQAAVAGKNQPQLLLFLGEAHTAYETLFWKSYLGLPAYSLYTALRSIGESVRLGLIEPDVTIETIASVMGAGDRHAILGRAARAGRQPVPGALATLVEVGVVAHWMRGTGRQRSHRFEVLPHLPILSARQSGQLPQNTQNLHEYYLGALREFDLYAWRHAREASFVPAAVKHVGMMPVY